MSDSTTTLEPPAREYLDSIRDELHEIFEEQRKLCHNINNPLTAIMGRAQILQLKKADDPELMRVVQVIEESAKRVAGHVRDLSRLIHRGRQTAGERQPRR